MNRSLQENLIWPVLGGTSTDNLSSLLVSLCVSAVITLTAVDICRALAVSTGTFKKQQGVFIVCSQLDNL